MSTTGKWVVWIVVIILIVGLGYWFFVNQAQAPQTGTQGQNPGGTSQTSDALPTASNDTSNTALDQDTAAIDAQLSGLSSDSASVDSSLNDQPVPQQ